MKKTTTFLKNTYDLHNDESLKQQATKHHKKIEGVPEKLHAGNAEGIIENLMQKYERAINKNLKDNQEPNSNVDDKEPNSNVDDKEPNSNVDDKQRKRYLEIIKQYLYQTAVVKEKEIPEKYRSSLNLSDEDKVQRIQTITEDQKDRINSWLEYLTAPTTKYPIELKYWAIRSMLGLEHFHHTKGKFLKRNNMPTANFPELNQKALAHVLASKKAELEGSQIQNFSLYDKEFSLSDKEFERFIQKKNFADRYSIAFKAYLNGKDKNLTVTKGEWKTYPQGSKANELVKSLKGQNTGRCTADYKMAKSQLEKGDFYVYYSEKDGANTKPRIAIRMENNKIGEIRGIQENQNLDPYMIDTLEAKLKDLSGTIDAQEQIHSHQETIEAMKKIQIIKDKVNRHEKLTPSDISTLYGKILGFGTNIDRDIVDLKNNTETLQLLGEYSRTDEFRNNIVTKDTYDKSIYQILISFLPENFMFPDSIAGSLKLPVITLPNNCILPKSISGDLELDYLTILPENFIFPRYIGGNLNLYNLISFPENYILPEHIGGDLNLHNFLSLPNNLSFPRSIGGNLKLPYLTSLPENCTLPESINGNLDLRSLQTLPENITFPNYIGGDLKLDRLTTLPENITFPQSIGGHLYLNNLTSLPENYKFPEGIRTIINTVSTKKESEQTESE